MTDHTLSEAETASDPYQQFGRWWSEVQAAGFLEPTAVTLATVGADGQPVARMVLLKDWDAEGFTFYTNYQSRKARELEASGRAGLLFFWDRLYRQVRIEGTVSRVSAAESDAYFATRPRGSQLGAWASPQSQTLPDRASLEARVAALETQYAGQPVPRPPHWGGYRVSPLAFEFWQGRESRLHDRIVYTCDPAGAWQRSRIAP